MIGNVGRLSPEKNQKFIIDIFEKMVKIDENSKLLIVGSGTLEDEIKTYIEEKKLTEKFILLKNRDDVNSILQVMDVFVFPSLYEGLGLVAIEAQASGLPTICSENIPEEVNITPLLTKLNLSDSIDLWINEIEKNKEYIRKDYSKNIYAKGFEIKNTAIELEKIYAKKGK